VQPFRQHDTERGTHRRPGTDCGALDQRSDFSARAAQLRTESLDTYDTAEDAKNAEKY
jgi:hypothetical protein